MDLLRDNIRHLMAGRSVNEVGTGSGVGQSWLRRLLLPGGTKKPDQDKLRDLAKYLNTTPSALMYQDLTGRPVESQPVGSEQQIVAASVKLLAYLEELAVEPFPSDKYADRLYFAMLVVREEGAEAVLDGSNLVGASRRLAAKLRAAG